MTAPAAPPVVLVTDGDSRPALALTRSLGARGVRVEVLAGAARSLAGVSRFAAAEHRVPDVERDPEAWAASVAALFESRPGALLVPITEAAMGTAYRADLAARGRVAAPPRDAYEIAVDKHRLLDAAADAGFAVPRTLLVEKPDCLRALPPGFAWPVVLKARRSRFLEGGRWIRGGVARVADAESLLAAAADPGLRAGALLQELVAGSGEGLFFAAEHGRLAATFAHRRVREKPPSGGVGVVVESIAVDPALCAPLGRLVERLGWHGVGMLELRRTPDGRAVVMELNPRLWGSLQLAIDAGADFPGWLLALHAGGARPEGKPCAGVRVRWLLGDLDHLLIALRRADERRAIGVSRATAIARFAAAFRSGARFDVLRRDDPAPFRHEVWSWLRAAVRRRAP